MEKNTTLNMKLEKPLKVTCIPYHPDIIINKPLEPEHITCKRILVMDGNGALYISLLDGHPKLWKFACKIRTVNMSHIFNNFIFDALLYFFIVFLITNYHSKLSDNQ